MSIAIDDIRDPPPGERPVEVVERKGIGHPDTICDALAEEVSRALSRHYVERFGQVLHHNVDKAILCGGVSSPRFGGGEVTEPIEIILAGRVTSSVAGVAVPAEALATEACRAWLKAHFHALDPDRHLRLSCRFRPGSEDLADLFARGRGVAVRANDTSIGVGFWPLSPLERTVLDIERWINDPARKEQSPELGEDVKVLGVREGATTRFTIACALVSAFVRDATDYLTKKTRLSEDIAGRARSWLGGPAEVLVNSADDAERGSFYLTVTGTSAEAGDDGQVGRGNRVNGLITPCRPMTMEAAAGKNPVSHVGKLYNVAAAFIAQDLVSRLPDISAAECMLVSRIGAPIGEPQTVSLRLRSSDRPAVEHAEAAREIIEIHLRGLPALSQRLVAGELGIY
jgi:S-adenosylmethionine synthetase